jgi:HD-like signal output (HDOD) protein
VISLASLSAPPRLSINANPIDRAKILKAAGAVGVLGSSGHAASRTLALLCDPEVSAHEVAALVNEEPALYARVLRVANSPYFGQSRAIGKLERAIVVLGLDAVRGIAAAACLDRSVPQTRELSLINTAALVQHSLATATAAESLARVHDPGLAPEAFIAGLLHNLGIIVQVHLDRSGIAAMIRERTLDPTRDMRLMEDERSIVGHEECIAVIFSAWQLPESLIAAARHHHDPMAAVEPHRRLAALVNLGANLGLAGGHTFTLEPVAVPRNAAAMQCLGLNDHDLDSVAIDLPKRVIELRRALEQQ